MSIRALLILISAILFSAIVISQPLLADVTLPFNTQTQIQSDTHNHTHNQNQTNNLSSPQFPITQNSTKLLHWIPIASKQALVCDIAFYLNCLNKLPVALAIQLPKPNKITTFLGQRTAMVLAVEHQNIAGLIIVSAKSSIPETISSINGVTYQLDLEEQFKLTLWHEMGHLENIALLGETLPASLSAYEHEWLADIYLVWRIAQEHKDLDLAWQQFHRRNMDLISDRNNMTHWSAPQLQWILSQYQLNDILDFELYSEFVTAIMPILTVPDKTERSEISSLVQRTFSHSTLTLPKYMLWRQQQLIDVIYPTLSMLMGENKAQQWLIEQFPEAEKMLKVAHAE
ncbi:hypothetical protein [Shewanella donghaensis]|uniref:hypothetical protein n=1 Tax=Shewanella donghaensis TaxID=238836 RepID=UPI001182BA6B|nr:hypothetical protein [Shewanella donghaensis]